MSDLDEVALGGAALREPTEYTAREGSLLVNLNLVFLSTLPTKEYDLRITLKNGLHASTPVRVISDTGTRLLRRFQYRGFVIAVFSSRGFESN